MERPYGGRLSNNIEHQSLEFVMYTMLPWFKRWEENINMQLLTPAERKAGFYLEFKIDGLLRGDAKSRAESYALGRQWGWLSVNDIRKLGNLSPILKVIFISNHSTWWRLVSRKTMSRRWQTNFTR
ncbi:phage portal protein [Paenibacillus sp. SYP-B3998]|uniref:phage portal protein n=1 Tax=Paenibacillus sp. SYP-B3998 TaxID=2678564 RepID=UPI0019683155|nr:phage portal protein [Paenibacillus sp. SYP-B3998]